MIETKDITLPYELALSELSLKEIGAIFKSFAFVKMNNNEIEGSIFKDSSEYLQIIEDLVNRGLISIDYDTDNKSTMSINLNQEKEPFWEMEEYDEYGNPTYIHNSGYHNEEEGAMYYRIHPILVNMKVEWTDCSDYELYLGYLEETFKSLEDAENYYLNHIQDRLKNSVDMVDKKFWIYDEDSSLHESNITYVHTINDIDHKWDRYSLYIRSMKTIDGFVWKLSSSLNPTGGVEIFSSEGDAQVYCENLIKFNKI